MTLQSACRYVIKEACLATEAAKQLHAEALQLHSTGNALLQLLLFARWSARHGFLPLLPCGLVTVYFKIAVVLLLLCSPVVSAFNACRQLRTGIQCRAHARHVLGQVHWYVKWHMTAHSTSSSDHTERLTLVILPVGNAHQVCGMHQLYIQSTA